MGGNGAGAMSESMKVSVVIPAKNEAGAIAGVVERIFSTLGHEVEVIVVDDGSTDDTADLAKGAGAIVHTHPYSMGNGAAVKAGFRKSSGDIVVFMDGDGQHNPEEIPLLLERLGEGFDMVVGARSADGQASVGRGVANRFYNWLASYMTNQSVKDLTSGFRAARADKFKEFLSLLPNGFSYPTTSTMAFFRAGYLVDYLPITVEDRIGESHINIVRDGVRFLLIIFKIGTLYSPLKIFLPISLVSFALGFSYYLYTFIVHSRFTNMSALFLTTSVLIFLMGLISEQITQLMYRDSSKDHRL